MSFKDSGEHREFPTGARRDRKMGKGRMDLMPMRAMLNLSKVYELGCLKYGDRNWEKGIKLSEYFDSGMRHFAKFMLGHDDEPHLHMGIWNMMCLDETREMIREGKLPNELNDLPNDTLNDLFEKMYTQTHHAITDKALNATS